MKEDTLKEDTMPITDLQKEQIDRYNNHKPSGSHTTSRRWWQHSVIAQHNIIASMIAIVLGLVMAATTAIAETTPVRTAAVPDPENGENWQIIKETLYEGVELLDGSPWMSFETPYRALDAAIVPIHLKVDRQQTDEDYVKSVTFIIDENPSPVAAVFNLTPKSGQADLSTRVRIDKYTFVRAVAEMNDGRHFMVANFVKAAGGCSAPGLAGRDAAMARLGKMKLKFLDAGIGDQPAKAQLLISHPNYSGLQFDQISRTEIPAHYVDSITVSQDGKEIFSAAPDISLSEDPSIHFHYRDDGGPIDVVVTDTEGGTFKRSWSPIPRADG